MERQTGGENWETKKDARRVLVYALSCYLAHGFGFWFVSLPTGLLILFDAYVPVSPLALG